MTTKTIATNVYDWIDERLGLSELAAFARNKTVPVHAQSFWYYWGGISLFLFLVQCFTGVLLLVYYRPGAEAFESVRQITFVMHFGWLIRSAHAWAANLMMFSILVHMFSVFFMKAYRKPREFGWLSGMALLAVAACFGFSGYLLPMDELSYFATKVGLADSGGHSVDRSGHRQHAARRPGRERIHRAALLRAARRGASRAVSSAARIPPVAGAAPRQRRSCQAKKPSRPPSASPCRSCPTSCAKTWPCGSSRSTFWRCWLRSFPGRWARQSDSLAPAPMGIHPEWYFMSPFEMLKLLGTVLPGEAGEIAGLLLFTLGIALWVLIPFYDTSKESGRRARDRALFRPACGLCAAGHHGHRLLDDCGKSSF